jgi:UDP-2-acetamido-2,6-beta-L-arabino-hexul-4-ose reductase
MNVVITGSQGFIGRNLLARLGQDSGYAFSAFDRDDPPDRLHAALAEADLVVHLAGINRPQSEEEFQTGNVDLTVDACNRLLGGGRSATILLASSIQAALDNAYGNSKRQAEEAVRDYAAQSGAPAIIYRFKNVFGKWCRPNYNSVVATFCHNIARGQPITISDPGRELDLVYVDDVVDQIYANMSGGHAPGVVYQEVPVSYQTTLGELAELLTSFRSMRQSLYLPDMEDAFARKLYATYLSYLPTDDFAYNLDRKCDQRGCLAEFLKSPHFGQIFVSRTGPGITRGNHFHHTKVEKFLVLEGKAAIRFRHIQSEEVFEYKVSGDEFRVVDIPPGFTHSIENIGEGELITLFWAVEIFDPNRADTYARPVLQP